MLLGSLNLIQVLIKVHVIGQSLTGRREMLSFRVAALEIQLGWTLMGKVPQDNVSKENLALSVTSMFMKEAENIRFTWNK